MFPKFVILYIAHLFLYKMYKIQNQQLENEHSSKLFFVPLIAKQLFPTPVSPILLKIKS